MTQLLGFPWCIIFCEFFDDFSNLFNQRAPVNVKKLVGCLNFEKLENIGFGRGIVKNNNLK